MTAGMSEFARPHHRDRKTGACRRLFLKQIGMLLGTGLFGCGGGSGSSPTPAALIAEPVVIRTQPADQTIISGNIATFQVIVSGSEPLTYQWKRGGIDIPGATQAAYVLGFTTLADNGAKFSVSISNQVGSVTSRTATLNVAHTGTTIDTTTIRIDTTLITIDEV